ncbi:hypothetical protein AZE42_03601 [Rhizopogon vesiculosus]|uniref:Glucose-methanol-choline oxidoreductase N-terminal domain-containing protein n=1 Tax=Rhizopogon vesiculosus TaxID=180088 RepID=A0A1J8Q1X2_9AGAM|nr:hypothetical protein AZE42_03601 [Rhizopogon vesiculosus]
MAYTRAPASDFDDWEVDGWESKNLIPLMKKLETYEVSSGGGRLGIFDEYVHVGTTYHKRSFADDTDDLETCNVYSPWAKYISPTTGRRSDAAHHYVYNQAHNPNLQLWAGKRVKRVIFENKRAVGVEFTSDLVSCPDMDQSLSTVRASKLVVVSAGAFGSPTILERSGGYNLSDHNGIFLPYFAADGAVTMDSLWRGDESVVQESLAQWKNNGGTLIAENGIDVKIKWRPDDEELKAMDSAFKPRWKEFFQDRPEKAVAIFTLIAGCVHITY